MKKGSEQVVTLLTKMNRTLELLAKKLDEVIDIQQKMAGKSTPKGPDIEKLPLDVTTLLSLPDHLRKSAIAISTLGEATATEVSKETGRVRAVESDYLNQLVGMGHLKKKRKARDVYFYVEG